MLSKIDILTQFLGTSRITDRNGNSYFHCPFCNHHNNKLTINIEKEVYNCFHCEVRGRGLLYLLKKMKVPDANQYKKIFNEGTLISITDIDNIFGEEPLIEKKLILPKGYENLFRNMEKEFYKRAVDYLLQRSLRKEDILKYDIHYSVSEQRVLFPSYDKDSNLNYYVARSIQPFENYKYKNAKASKRNVIFNEHLIEWNKPLYVVEGIFDAILSRKNAVPILGSNIGTGSLLFKRLLENRTEVIVALDADAKKKVFNLINKLVKFNVKVTYVDWENEKRDIAEIGSEEFEEIVTSGSVKSFTFADEVKERLFK